MVMEVNGYKIKPGANLEGANLSEEANLFGADLAGANLTGAIMPDGSIHD